MRTCLLGLLVAGFTGAAAASEPWTEPREHAAGDYSAQAYWRLDFGTTGPAFQSVGLRFDSERAAARGAPPVLQARFGAEGLDQLRLNGVELRGTALSANQTEGGYFSTLSFGEWIVFGFTLTTFGVIVSEATDTSDEPSVSGTGAGGG